MQQSEHARRSELADPERTVAIVVNPSKIRDLDQTRSRIGRLARESGWGTPIWFETAKDDDGVGAARAALACEPDLVCVMGGDGTVRVVATVLRGSRLPLAILPSGTGNLLARNLGIPLGSLEDALEVAFQGQNRAIDVGLATFADGVERVFVVMSGVGLDADVMAQTDDRLKERVGWGAYVVAGGARMFREGFVATLSIDGKDQPPRDSLMVLACNCSSVVANIDLATGALLDDGNLQLVTLQPKAVIGWMGVAVDVAAGLRNGATSLGQWEGTDVHFELDRPVLAEIDGDLIGPTRSGRFGVDPAALIVRLPVPVRRGVLQPAVSRRRSGQLTSLPQVQ